MRIYLDCDDVLLDLTGAILDSCNARMGTNLTRNDLQDWEVDSILPAGTHWWEFTNVPGFFRDLKPLPGSVDLVDAVRASGRAWGFLTSLPIKHTGNVMEERRICIDNNFAVDGHEIPSRRIIIAKRKELVVHEGDVLIDDYEHNIEAVEAVGGVGLLVAAPSNRKSQRPRWTLEQVRAWVLSHRKVEG